MSGTGKALGPKYAGAIRDGMERLGFDISVCALSEVAHIMNITKNTRRLFIACGYEEILILIFSKNDSIKIAADKVTQHDADIHAQNLEGMSLEEGYRYACIIECICHAVGKATYDEERNREQERKHVSFAGECYRCGHKKAARNAEKATCEGSGTESELEDLLSSSLDVHRRHA